MKPTITLRNLAFVDGDPTQCDICTEMFVDMRVFHLKIGKYRMGVELCEGCEKKLRAEIKKVMT